MADQVRADWHPAFEFLAFHRCGLMAWRAVGEPDAAFAGWWALTSRYLVWLATQSGNGLLRWSGWPRGDGVLHGNRHRPGWHNACALGGLCRCDQLQVAVAQRLVGAYPQVGAGRQGFGLLELALLKTQYTEVVQGGGIVRLDMQGTLQGCCRLVRMAFGVLLRGGFDQLGRGIVASGGG